MLAVGLDVQRDERVITTKVGRAQLLFLDGTALTLGPESKVILDRFIYNPHKGTGTIALNLAQGALRLVGGKISKVNPINIQTPVATVGIRGGISIIFYEPGQPLKALFLFGKDMSVSANGVIENALRPGSIIAVGSNGSISPARLATAQEVKVMLAPLLANSGNEKSTSFVNQVNNAANRTNDAANNTNAPPIGGGSPNSSDEAGGLGSQNASNLPQNTNDIIANSTQTEGTLGSNTGNDNSGNTNAGTGSTGNNANSQSGSTSTGGNQTANAFAGGEIRAPGYNEKSFNPSTEDADRDATTNTTVQSESVANGEIQLGFANGDNVTLPYAAGSTLLLYSADNSTNFSGPIIGGGVVAADRSFFFYNGLLSGSSRTPIAIFGGTPTPTTGFPITGFGAYAVGDAFNTVPFYPVADYDAATERSPESIRTLVQNGAVSSLYTAFSGPLSITQQNAANAGPAEFQASLGVEGQGPHQTSFLVGEVGGFVTESAAKGIALGGAVRGVFQEDANNAPLFIAGGASSAEVGGPGDVEGNAIFGPDAANIVLVPDQLGLDANGTSVQRMPGVIASGTIGQWANSSATANYAVVEATQIPTPSGLGTSRTSETLQGYAGTVMFSAGGSDDIHPDTNGEILTTTNSPPSGLIKITTDPASNRLQATFNLADGWHSRLQPSVTLNFGNFSGSTGTASAFIDDTIFAARESNAPGSPSSLTTVKDGKLMTSPVTAQLLMVSAAAVPLNAADGFLPSGVKLCTCSFLNWGYWEGTIQHTAANDSENGMVSGIPVSTWVAGTVANPTWLPTTGEAVYQGQIIGNVDNGGNSYLAAGSFQNSWNFAARSGAVKIDQFDKGTFTGTATSAAGSANFTGSFVGTRGAHQLLSGTLNGSFFKSASDVAREAPAGMGGAFAITGQSYKAAGTFAAQRTR